MSASGELVWVGEGPAHVGADAASSELRGVSCVRRGTEKAWLGDVAEPVLSERAQRLREHLQSRGALFFSELQQLTSWGTHVLRDALRELVVAGLATNDTMDALGHVARWRPLFDARASAEQNARWLPADFTPSPNRPTPRRVNVRRLPRWKRPDREGGEASWPGRWSLIDRGPAESSPSDPWDSARANVIATQWLERYGVVARDWGRRGRPPVPWRAIYRELRRMELRGDVRRGYFVQGLAGAQFALPAAVEQLRGAANSDDAPLTVITASDPANVWSLPLAEPGATRDAFARPRGARAMLVLNSGRVVMTADAQMRAVSIRPGTSADVVAAAARALVAHVPARRRRGILVEAIDGADSTVSPQAAAFIAAEMWPSSSGLPY